MLGINTIKRAFSRTMTSFHASESSTLLSMLTPTASKVQVTSDTALNLSSVWAARNMIASSMGVAPREVVRPLGDREQKGPIATDHKVHKLLNSSPNPRMDSISLFSKMTDDQTTFGNGYAEIERDISGEKVVGLHWIRHERVDPRILDRDVEDIGSEGDLIYFVASGYEEDGKGKREIRVAIPDRDMLNFKNKLTIDGIVGRSTINAARENIGTGIAVDQHGAEYFGTNGLPRAVVTVQSRMKPEHKVAFRKEWKEVYENPDNKQNLAILEDGATFNPVQISNADMQFLETKRFTVEDIGRWYAIPPVLLGDYSGLSQLDVEAFGKLYRRYCLAGYVGIQENEMEGKLLSQRERDRGYTISIDVDKYDQATFKDRAEGFSILHGKGLITQEDVAQALNMPVDPIFGKARVMQMNMTTVDAIMNGENLKASQNASADKGGVPGDATNSGKQNSVPEENAKKDDAAHKWFAETSSRLLNKEQNEVSRAAKKPKQFHQWVGPYYDKLQGTMAEAFSGPCSCLQEDAEQIAETYCQHRKKQLVVLIQETPMDRFPDAVAESITQGVTL